MSIDPVEVMLSTLNGDDTPKGWTHYSNGSVSAIAHDEFWEKAFNHPSVINHHKEMMDKNSRARIQSIRFNDAPKSWDVS